MKSSTTLLLVILLIGVINFATGAIPTEKKGSKEDSGVKKNSKEDSGEKKDSKEGSGEKKDSNEKKDTEPLIADYKKFNLVIQNEVYQTVIHLNYFNFHVGFFNGKTGEAFIFQNNDYRGVYLTSKESNLIWNSNNTKTYNSKTNLIELYKIGQTYGIQFETTTISKHLSHKLNKILKTQSLDFSSDCKSIGNAVQITRQVQFSKIDNFWNLFPESQIQLKGDFNYILAQFHGLQNFQNYFEPEKYQVFISRNITISFEQVFSKDQSGFEVLQTFLKALGDKNLITKYLDRLNNPNEFIKVVSDLSGRVYYGYDGALNFIYQVLRYLDGNISLRNLHYELHLFVFNQRAFKVNIEDRFKKDSERLYKFIKDELKMEKEFKNLLEFLKKLKDGKFTYNDVNISEICKILGNVPEKKDEVSDKVTKEVTKGKGKDSHESKSDEESKESREYKPIKNFKSSKARKHELSKKLHS